MRRLFALEHSPMEQQSTLVGAANGSSHHGESVQDRYILEALHWETYYDDADICYEWDDGQLAIAPMTDYAKYMRSANQMVPTKALTKRLAERKQSEAEIKAGYASRQEKLTARSHRLFAGCEALALATVESKPSVGRPVYGEAHAPRGYTAVFIQSKV